MSNFYVCYSDEAKDDLRNIFMYIAYNLGSRDNAEGQMNRIREAIKKLDKFPKRNAPVPYDPWASLGMRRLNVGIEEAQVSLLTMVRYDYIRKY